MWGNLWLCLVMTGINDFNCLWHVGNWIETCEKYLGVVGHCQLKVNVVCNFADLLCKPYSRWATTKNEFGRELGKIFSWGEKTLTKREDSP